MALNTFDGSTSAAAAALDANFARFTDLETLPDSGVSLAKGYFLGHVQFRSLIANSAARIYCMPNGRVTGVPAAIKIFMDDYYATSSVGGLEYRDCGLYGDTTIKGPMGAGTWLINSKTAGSYFGFVPQIGISRSDGNAICQRWVTINAAVTEATAATFSAAYKGGWYTGLVVAIGDTCSASTGKAYQATTAGTCGATIPSHTTGTASDGGVTWQFLWDNAASSGGNIKMFAVIGKKDDALLWSTSSKLYEAGVHLTQDAVLYPGKDIVLVQPDGTPVGRISAPSSNGADTYIQSMDGTKSLRISLVNGFIQPIGMQALACSKTIANGTGGSQSADASGCDQIVFGHTAATTITSFTGGRQYQHLTVRSGNGNTTLQNNASIVTATGADRVLTANTCLKFEASGSGTVFTEVGKL